MQGPPIPEEPQAMGPTGGSLSQLPTPPGPPNIPATSADIWATYAANQAAARQQVQLRQPLPEEKRSVGQTIVDVLTFGQSAAGRGAYRQGYNIGVQRYNEKQLKQADELAKYVTNLEGQRQLAMSAAERAQFGQTLALSNYQLRIMEAADQARQRDYQMWRDQNRDEQKLSVPPTADQTAQGVARGQSWESGKGWSKGGRVASYRPVPAGAPLGELSSREGGSPAAPGAGDDSAALAGLQGPGALEAARARKKQAVAASSLEAKPMEGEDRKVISGILRLRALMKRSQEEFTPAEREKYVGVLRNPTERAKQFFQGDTKFQKFQALVGQMQTQKFELAGAALTAGEQAVLDKFLPSGAEVGGAQEFDNKVNEFYKSSLDQAKQRMKLGQGRGAVAEELAAESETISPTPSSPSAPAGAKTRTLSSGKVIYEE